MSIPDKPYAIPEIQEINRLPMHGAEIPFGDAATAKAGERESSPWYMNLDGKWDFKLYHRPEDLPENFFSADCREKLETIQVPSNWTLTGRFDRPIYTNIAMPYRHPAPPLTPEENPTGVYRTWFQLPKNWANRRVVLHVGGAESYLEVYLNGHFVGMGKDTRLPSEFDLTPFVENQKKNLLVCRVIHWSDSSFVEDQDQWWMAGIYRSVYLYSTAYTYIEDLFSNGDYDVKKGDGLLSIRTHLGFHISSQLPRGPEKDFTQRSTLFDGNGKIVWREKTLIDHRFRISSYCATQRAVIRHALPWSAEKPDLYTLVVELFDERQNLLDVRRKKVGFRNIRIAGRDLLFNGKRVLIRGVNRHEHSMYNGKAVSRDEMLADICLLKQYNFNAVRTSHYPDDHFWYDLCDEYGIYVLDEANFECHAYYPQLTRDPRWKNSIVARGERMVLRDRSHACIFSWSLGNESGNGENHIAEAEAILALDDTRPIHHEGELRGIWAQSGVEAAGGNTRYNAFIDPMYSSIEQLKQYAKAGDRPVIPCEYAHAMGNSSGSLCDYWDLFRKHPGIQGGFIWDWIDQGLLVKDGKGRAFYAYGGDFGEKLHDLDFNCNGMIACDRRIHPAMNEFRHLVQPVSVSLKDPAKFQFVIASERDFCTLGDLKGAWTLEVDGKQVDSGALPDLSCVQPGKSICVSLPLKTAKSFAGKEAFVNFAFRLAKKTKWAKAGTLLAHDQICVTGYLELTSVENIAATTHPALREASRFLTIVNGKNSIVIEKTSGRGSLRNGRKLILSSLFDSNLFRAGTDNDGIRGWTGQENKPLGKWLAAGLDQLTAAKIEIKTAEKRDGSVAVTIRKALVGKDKKAQVAFLQTITAKRDGTFHFDQKWKLPASFPSMPRIGVLAMTGAGFESVSWYGRGPWENYSDRCRSAQISRYETTVREMYEDSYIVPQENGNRTGVRWMMLKSRQHSIRISGNPFEFGVSYYTPQELFAAYHQCELFPRKETVVTLDLAQRGLGTGSCGPQTLPQYELSEKNYRFQFDLEIQ